MSDIDADYINDDNDFDDDDNNNDHVDHDG